MTWPSFVAPAAGWLALAALPLVLLYFLKLRRQPHRLGSLVLWQQVLLDERVNAPFQRLRRSLLLLLQLLVLALLVLGAMQPSCQAGPAERERVLVLLDRSASMAARAEPAGPTRLELARAQVEALIDGLRRDEELALIAFAQAPRLVSPFTGNKRMLRQALAGIDVEDQGDDLGPALRMAGALAQTTRLARVLLVSDGNVPETTAFELPFSVEYVRVSPGGPNLGITQLRATRDPEARWALLVEVEASEGAAMPARLRLWQDGELRAEEPVAPRGGAAERFAFTVDAPQRTAVELQLAVDGFDALAADDSARLELWPPRAVRARVAGGLDDFRRVLAAVPDVELLEPGAAAAPDLVVAADEEALGDAGAEAVHLLVGVVPSELAGLIELADGGAGVVDQDRADPLLEHVELSELALLQSVRWRDGAGERDLEQRGFATIVHGTAGPLVLRRGRAAEPGQSYAMLFDPARSTLPYRVAFPMLAANLAALAMRANGLRDVPGLRAGVLPPLAVDADGSYTVRGPDGGEVVAVARGQRLRGVRAPRCGWYVVARDGREERRAGANLLDRDETLLVSRPRLQLGELAVTAAAREVDAPQPVWPALALVAFGVLLLEWWLFRRRHLARGRTPLPAAGAVLLAVALTPAGGAAQRIAQTQWGFDGGVVPGRFNLLSVVVENERDEPFRGVLQLRKSSGVARLGAPLAEEVYLAPHSKRLVQLHPFAVDAGESWSLSWAGARLARVDLPTPAAHVGAVALLGSDEVVDIQPARLALFPARWFPTTPGGAASLADAVLDHAPDWEAGRREAFLRWLQAGGRLHLVRGPGGVHPRFDGELEVLNEPGERFRVGAGTVIRYAASRHVVGPRMLDLTVPPPPPGETAPEPPSALAPELLQELQRSVDPDHDWALIFVASIVFLLLVGPVHWVLARRYLDYRLSILALLGIIAAFTWLFLVIGARGYGEQTRIVTLAWARCCAPGVYDTTLYSNAFATAGGRYAIRERSDSALFSTAQRYEAVDGIIDNGRGGRFEVEIPLFSSRPFVRHAVHASPAFALVPEQWDGVLLEQLVLRADGAFPPDGRPLCAWALRGDRAVELRLTGGRLRAATPTSTLAQVLHLDEVRGGMLRHTDGGFAPYGREPQKTTIEQLARELAPALIAEQLGLISPEGERRFARRDGLVVLAVGRLPESCRVDASGLGAEDGYVIYRVDIDAER